MSSYVQLFTLAFKPRLRDREMTFVTEIEILLEKLHLTVYYNVVNASKRPPDSKRKITFQRTKFFALHSYFDVKDRVASNLIKY